MQVSHSGLRGSHWSLFIEHTPPRVIARRQEILLLMILLTPLQVVILLQSRYQHFVDDPLTIFGLWIGQDLLHRQCRGLSFSFLSHLLLENTIVTF